MCVWSIFKIFCAQYSVSMSFQHFGLEQMISELRGMALLETCCPADLTCLLLQLPAIVAGEGMKAAGFI